MVKRAHLSTRSNHLRVESTQEHHEYLRVHALIHSVIVPQNLRYRKFALDIKIAQPIS